MGIQKIATNTATARRDWIYTPSAREAWRQIIEKYKPDNPNLTVFLPSYIGWSPNEGSGIFDSVVASEVNYQFYTLDIHLKINLDFFKETVSAKPGALVLLVHYFGFVDENYTEIVRWLKQENIDFVEDCAHAWLSDLVGGTCGRNSKYSFYSLHKILPVQGGGMLVDNAPQHSQRTAPELQLGFDLYKIYQTRRRNFEYLTGQLKALEEIELLYKNLPPGICPQTLPVLLKTVDRNMIYHKMNERGFGMVSLYHTMIKELDDNPSDSCKITSQKIINFPVHQDITFKDIDDLIISLKEIL